MTRLFLVCFLLISFGSCSHTYAQETRKYEEHFTIRGSIRYQSSYEPIKGAEVYVNGGSYTTTDQLGEFRVKVRMGDILTLSHKDIQTVNYEVNSKDRIIIEVEGENKRTTDVAAQNINANRFKSLMDSVAIHKNSNIEKSINFIYEGLGLSNSKSQNAEAYEALADVYFYWKQNDLAISNYRISLQNEVSNRVRIKLAKAYELNDDLENSQDLYNSIKTASLSNWNAINLYEGLGDLYFKLKKYQLALDNYQKAMQLAKEKAIEAKLADLASKTGMVNNAFGRIDIAEQNFNSALNFSQNLAPERVVEEKVKIADFRNTNKNYEAEIEIREDILSDVESIELDSILPNESALTPQKQNYKIGNALYLDNKNEAAIGYFKKSIEEAEKKEDLVVKKDAQKKIADIYEKSGDYGKAKQTFEDYMETVNELYVKREQEISQAARLSKKIAENQSRITSLEMDRQLSESSYKLTQEQAKRQQWVIYSLAAGLILVLGLSYLLYKYLRQQRFTNDILALKSLRSQMNPHFIFNALNSVNSFIAMNDERTANRYLTDFSYLMREVLENSEKDFIPLEKELHLLKLYTKLEHFRFKDKFDYEITVDPNLNLNDYQIPPMLLQPYIENAVWHGLRYKDEPGILRIDFNKLSEDTLLITIMDNGIGRTKSKELKTQNQDKHKSKGLSNIEKRVGILNRMHKDKIDIAITDNDLESGEGTVVKVTLKK